jgi:hypothetical protein
MALEFAHLAGAVLAAFAGMVLVKSRRDSPMLWLLRAAAAMALFAGALWIVYGAIPYPADQSVPTFSIVGSAVLIAGLAADELVGADIRHLFRM